jgi:hypothetical protein
MDIELLFRKFTSDFAERYRIKAIQLTPEAQQILLSQRFPGNIRQLKNLAEQISILEVDDRIIDAPKLTHYLQMNNGQSIGNGLIRRDFEEKQADNFSERELLYKILFDMRKDVTELKKMFLEVLKNGEINPDILKGNESLFQNLEPERGFPYSPNVHLPETNPARILNGHTDFQPNPELTIINYNGENPENKNGFIDVTHEAEEVSFSLEKQEKDMIIKALQKNKNKRKYAAQDLGISERTLYRKIKQYDIEEE